MPSQTVKLFKLKLKDGYLCDMHPIQQWYAKEFGRERGYTSGWIIPNTGTFENWEAYIEEKGDDFILQEYPYYEYITIEVQQHKMVELVENKIAFTVDSISELDITYTVGERNEILDQMLDKNMKLLERYTEQITTFSKNTFNAKVGVHSGSSALQEYNQLMLVEDSCTDNVQSYLAEGWRIVAVCPQPDSRRPDYILGKVVPEHRISESAERG